jgi:hypothetical protein
MVPVASFAVVGSATGAAEYVGPRRGEVYLIRATTKVGRCQVRSKTEHRCLHQAVTEIWGIPFCESCALEQEVYFAIGKLAMQAQGLAPELSRRIAEAGRGRLSVAVDPQE